MEPTWSVLYLLLLCLGAWLGIQLLFFLVMLVQMLRLSLYPQRLQLGELPEGLTPDQQAAIDEVRALGFHPIASGPVENGPRSHPALLLRHESEPAYASLLLMPASFAGYPLSFFSHAEDGSQLLTVNRIGWLTLAQPPEQKLVDAWAASPAEHWQAHRARIAGVAMAGLPDEEVCRRYAASYEDYLPMLLRHGLLQESGGALHPRLRTAAGLARRWMGVRRKLAAPYVSAATEGAHQPDYATQSYLQAEADLARRASRHSLKAGVLVLSAALSLLLWGWAFNWQSALAVLAILLLHEGGHALAMRAFGYRDMSMFFIPFLGAMVTGRPRDIPAWKQALVLLAGPVPGLLLGAAVLWTWDGAPPPLGGFDWQMAAWMAVLINLFNLLPLTPLDGGQLVELSLFSRWPRSRLLFSALSVAAMAALGLWLKSAVFVVFVLLLGMLLLHQWRASRLESRWQEGLQPEEQLRQLFGRAQELFGPVGFLRQYPLVKAVMERRRIGRPRAWESALVLGLLLALWGGGGFAAYDLFAPGPASAAEDDGRSPQQRRFDEQYALYGEDEEGGADELKALQAAAAALPAEDPRQVDLRSLLAWQAEGAEQARQLESLLAEGRQGLQDDLESLQRRWLRSIQELHADEPLPQRIAALQAALERAESLMPKQPAGRIEARLRLAEWVDLNGDPQAAETLLADTRYLAERSDDCRCELRRVLRAQAWYFMHHGRPTDAVTVIEASPVGRSLRQSTHELSRTYAWALLEAGRTDEGIAQMRTAAYSRPRPRSWLQRLGFGGARRSHLLYPLEMAHALRRGPQPAEAGTLMTPERSWSCMRYTHEDFGDTLASYVDPWEQLREKRLRETAQAVCPPDSGKTGVTAKKKPAG
jgi:Zn-dependent protease